MATRHSKAAKIFQKNREKAEWQEKEFDLKALVEESHQTLKEHAEGGNA
jgi:hypothetical protein